MEFKIHFSGRAHAYTEDEVAVVSTAMRDAEPLTQGRYMRAFQEAFCNYSGAQHAFAVCNATAALEMAAQFCGFQPGDEVIIPSHTFTASAYPFLKNGAKIVWADVDPNTRVVSPETIKKCITPRTKAVVVVHLYGFAAEMPAIMELTAKHGLLTIEDAAQSLGVEIMGRKTGTFGDFGVFSFHSHKNISTLGEGGMLTVRTKEHADLVPLLRHNGHCAFPFARDDYWIPAMGNVDFPELNGQRMWPNNYCLGEIECALGIKLLDRIDTINHQKRVRALKFIDALADFPELVFHREPTSRHNYHLLAATMNNGRDLFIRKMAQEKAIQCVVQYYPLNRYALYQKAGYGKADCPNADHFFDHMISFPFHHWLNDDQLDYILESSTDILNGLR